MKIFKIILFLLIILSGCEDEKTTIPGEIWIESSSKSYYFNDDLDSVWFSLNHNNIWIYTRTLDKEVNILRIKKEDFLHIKARGIFKSIWLPVIIWDEKYKSIGYFLIPPGYANYNKSPKVSPNNKKMGIYYKKDFGNNWNFVIKKPI